MVSWAAGGLLAGEFKSVKEVYIICSSFFSRERLRNKFSDSEVMDQLHVFWSSWIFSFSNISFCLVHQPDSVRY